MQLGASWLSWLNSDLLFGFNYFLLIYTDINRFDLMVKMIKIGHKTMIVIIVFINKMYRLIIQIVLNIVPTFRLHVFINLSLNII